MCSWSNCKCCKGWNDRKGYPICKVNHPDDFDKDNPCPDYWPKDWNWEDSEDN
ncbi:MAG: hypothetical protein LBK25_05580 [Treponema sp.]|jgi:hypothetical protein|nr:hypothetical protein [Treponema sp.]